MHHRQQVRAIARSIQAFGFNAPILVSGKNRIVAGHEGHVITAIALFLADQQKVVAELCPNDAAPTVAKVAIGQARLLGDALTAEFTPDRYELIRSLIVRVGIDDASICVELRRTSLIEKLGLPIEPVSRGNDPLYVDTAIDRWQRLTGRPATLGEGGRTFLEVCADRTADADPVPDRDGEAGGE